MQKYNPLRKGTALVVLVLFIGMSIIPSTVGVDKSSMPTFNDITPPEITDVTLTTSDPLDTEPGFGWENFSCMVTDDTEVHTVKIIINYYDGTILEHTMTRILGTDVYYYYTTFTDAGYYMYSIWANDTERNNATSSPEVFALPLNADIDMSGCVDFWDLLLLSVVPPGCTGPPGWIREDINNNGLIDFMDEVELSLYMNDCLSTPPWMIPPEITNITVTTPGPIYTEPGIRWENFSCTVTDNDGVDEVEIHLTYPDSHTEQIPMIKNGDTYYYNTTLADAGQYPYCIWADDIIDVEITSAVQYFDLPTKWDVDMDGCVHFMDLVAVSLAYNDEGPPGWIREDVDDNGRVHFMDLVAVSSHYNECWN